MPPGIHVGDAGVFCPPNVGPVVRQHFIHPRALFGVKADFSVVFFWPCDVNFGVGDVHVAAHQHNAALLFEGVHVIEDAAIEHQFFFPCLGAFAAVGKIDGQQIPAFAAEQKRQVRHPPFVGVGRIGDAGVKAKLAQFFNHRLGHPDAGAGVAFFLGAVVVLVIVRVVGDNFAKLFSVAFGFL